MVMNSKLEQVDSIFKFAFDIVKDDSCLSVTKWAETHRILTKKVSAMDGLFRYSNTPFTREIAEKLSPDDPTREIAAMKAAQAGFTSGVIENSIGFSIDNNPCPMMYVSGDLKLLTKFKDVRINNLIDYSGLRKKIVSESFNQKSKKQGDTAEKIDFVGGFLVFVGSHNATALRSFSIQNLYLDELDSYPKELGEDGDPVELAVTRTSFFSDVRKIVYGSTPLLAHNSRIYEQYKKGDQRKWQVPCPFCGCFQELEFYSYDGGLYPDDKGVIKDGILQKPYGIVFDVAECKDGNFSSVRYKCKHCGELIPEYYKTEMNSKGFWQPTATSKKPHFVSYHISGLFLPKVPWENIVFNFLDAGTDPVKLRVFYNNYLGLPFEESSSSVDISTVYKLKDENLPSNTLPEDALFVTVTVDVQDDRLEMDIKAWGERFRSWCLDHRVIYGNTSDINDACWRELSFIPYETWNGLNATLGLIDSGDGEKTYVVYQFCAQMCPGFFYPLKGFKASVKTNNKYKIVKLQDYDTHLVEIYVDLYKNQIANWFNQEWRPNEPYPDGWMTFANSFTDDYFKQLTNERKVKKTTKGGLTVTEWVKKGANEAWDLNIYNLCAAEIVIYQVSVSVLNRPVSDPRAVFEYYKRLKS